MGEGHGLLDLGFIGNRYTWSHRCDMATRIAARLDRALCCDEWRRTFASATVRNLSQAHSDHCPVLLKLGGVRRRRLGDQLFCFQEAWLLHPEFSEWIEKEWVRERNLMCSLSRFAEKLSARNRDTFGYIF